MRDTITRAVHATAILAGGLRTALPALFGLSYALFVATVAATVLGLPWLPRTVRPLRALADAERRRVGRALGREIPTPYRPVTGPRAVAGDPATWRDLAWQIEHAFAGTFSAIMAALLWPILITTVTVPAWWWAAPRGRVSVILPLTNWPEAVVLPLVTAVAVAAIMLWLLPPLANGQARLAESLLRPTPLAERLAQLTETRTEALEAHGAELRRIERDLHDGVQAQLVSVALRLGLAERTFTAEPARALALLHDARDGIDDTLGNLRAVIRGIYPPILSDRGLAGAVRALAGAHRIPVAVDIPEDLPRPPAAVEAAAYFVVAEALTNVARHSHAERAEVALSGDDGWLRIMVRDNGRGGADPASGTGLTGIRRRVAALDGTTRIDSPAGDGTTIEVGLPCAS